VTLKTKRPVNPAYPKSLVTLGDHIRKRRLDLGLRQVDVGRVLGVAKTAITGWEKGYFAPHITVLPRIIAFLGYTPEPYSTASGTVAERMKCYRQVHGLSQEKFARLLGVDETTVMNWERGEHVPSKKLMQKFATLFPQTRPCSTS
jgi:DNA-binding XRE family transcriptional regulator